MKAKLAPMRDPRNETIGVARFSKYSIEPRYRHLGESALPTHKQHMVIAALLGEILSFT
jgi:hypothetical protein